MRAFTVIAALVAMLAPAEGNTITATLSGSASNSQFVCDDYCGVVWTQVPAIATFNFDTNIGIFSDPAPNVHRFDGQGDVTLDLGSLGFWQAYGPPGYITWGDGAVFLDAAIGTGYYHVSSYGYQFGNCPSSWSPCGFLNLWGTITGVLDESAASLVQAPQTVPGPIVGGGIPGLVLLLYAAIRLRRWTTSRLLSFAGR